jgi:hypothetical protein
MRVSQDSGLQAKQTIRIIEWASPGGAGTREQIHGASGRTGPTSRPNLARQTGREGEFSPLQAVSHQQVILCRGDSLNQRQVPKLASGRLLH